MKRCYTCNINKPLFLFHKNKMKYKLSFDQGRCVECRLCCAKRFIKQRGKVVKYDFSIKKFYITNLPVTIKNIIKEYF